MLATKNIREKKNHKLKWVPMPLGTYDFVDLANIGNKCNNYEYLREIVSKNKVNTIGFVIK